MTPPVAGGDCGKTLVPMQPGTVLLRQGVERVGVDFLGWFDIH
ncbi:MAG TPA: hypothetical protein VIH59_31375 [Candidatus Tectomicrobia bacterium]